MSAGGVSGSKEYCIDEGEGEGAGAECGRREGYD